MSRIPVHSYGAALRNRRLRGGDHGAATRLAMMSRYKFTIAFENSVTVSFPSSRPYPHSADSG